MFYCVIAFDMVQCVFHHQLTSFCNDDDNVVSFGDCALHEKCNRISLDLEIPLSVLTVVINAFTKAFPLSRNVYG